jgi:protein-glutamine gamma-glutamyltransferase
MKNPMFRRAISRRAISRRAVAKQPAAAQSITTQSIATLCSLCLCLWGYQTGAWQLAIPMALLLEARNLLKRRWTFPRDYLSILYALGGGLWFVAIFLIPIPWSTPTLIGTLHHLLKCLPVGFFPLILLQTYASNFTALYQNVRKKNFGSNISINFYYPYFGICLLAASATGGQGLPFLLFGTLLIAGFLGILRSQRFSSGLFYGLILLAVVLSLVGTQQVSRLQVNIQLNPGEWIGQLFQQLTSSAKDRVRDRDLDSIKPANSPQASVSPSSSPTPSPSQRTVAPENPLGSGTSNPNPPEGSSRSDGNPANRNPLVPISPVPNPASSSATNPVATASPNVSPSPQGGKSSNESRNENLPQQSNPPNISNPQPEPLQSAPQRPGQDTAPGTPPGAPAASPSANPVGSGNGKGSGAPISGGSPQAGGRIDPQTSNTRIGQQGSLQPADTVLFRVTPSPKQPSAQASEQPQLPMPLYLRAATFNQYRSASWNAVNPKFTPKPAASQQRWQFAPQTPTSIALQISTDWQQPNDVLKLPVGTSEIDRLGLDAIQVNQYGTVIAQGKPGPITYIATFDPSQSLDSPPTQLELDIPPVERPTLEKILKSLNLNQNLSQNSTPTLAKATLQAVEAFFQKGFRYSLDLPKPQTNSTPLSDFLLRHRTGHCEYFASATSLLLRAAGIPSRYVVGYSVHEFDPSQQAYLVRASDAHAWVTAYVDGTWVTLDTTPGDGQLASGGTTPTPATTPAAKPTATSGQTPATSPTQTPQDPAQQDQAQHNRPVNDRRTWPEKIGAAWAALTAKQKETLVWTAAMLASGLVLLLGCGLFIWRVWRRKRHPQALRRLSGQNLSANLLTTNGLDSDFYVLEQQLGQWGLERQPAETAKKWMVRLHTQFSAEQAMQLQEIIDLHYRYRFDPQGISEDDRAQLQAMIQAWLRENRVALSRRHQQLTSAKESTPGQ